MFVPFLSTSQASVNVLAYDLTYTPPGQNLTNVILTPALGGVTLAGAFVPGMPNVALATVPSTQGKPWLLYVNPNAGNSLNQVLFYPKLGI